MNKVILCGHTGSNNHGCEAIIRSTLEIFRKNSIESAIATFRPEQDIAVNLNDLGELITYRNYKNNLSPFRIYNGLAKKVFGNNYPEQRFIQKNVFEKLKECGAAVVVGGDTYCYNRNACLGPYAVNKYANRIGKPSILWSCSIGKENITQEMISDLKSYTMIFPRESLTYQNMLEIGISEKHLCLMSDSAFTLHIEKVELPDNFCNVFAYNPSYTLEWKKPESIIRNRYRLIEYILNQTDMNIALIPHVYGSDYGDVQVCREIYNQYSHSHSNRIFLFDKLYNCMQLKYIISQCRFLVAERTHASVAGYSTGVPTFVVGYSVKSSGIAKDIFGQADKYVQSSSELHSENVLTEKMQYILEHEQKIKLKLEDVMPGYIAKAENAGRVIRSLVG